jgi:hypothetical protein
MMKSFSFQVVILFLFILAICITQTTTTLAGDISVQASLQPTRFSVNQTARLTITVTGARSASPKNPHGNGLQFFSRGQSTQMQWTNGKSSSSISFSYLIKANQPGSHTIDPITIEVGGQSYTTKAIKCVVDPASTATALQTGQHGGQPVAPPSSGRLRSSEGDQVGFMRIVPEKETAYAGELLPFTIKAFFRQGMRVTIQSSPRLTKDNFILNSLDEKPDQREEIIKGIPYILLTWHGSVSAVKQGSFPMAVELDASLLVRSRRKRPSSMFGSPLLDDPFFDDFFNGYTQKNVTLVSLKHTIKIKDLPEQGKPAEFNGAIGSFGLSVKAQPTIVQPGDPITLKMLVKGSGNFDRVKAPAFKGSGDKWKTYPPSTGKLETIGGLTKKQFEQAIIPISTNIHRVPSVTFSYFDPKSERYITLHSDPIPITLKGTRATAPAPARQQAAQPQLPTKITKGLSGSSLAPIHTEYGKTVRELRPLYLKKWFQLLIAASLLVLTTTLVLLLRKRRLAANPELVVKKELAQKIDKLLTKAKQALQEENSSRFLIICRQILQLRFGLVWQVEAQAISGDDFAQRLPKTSPLPEIIKKAEHAAYTDKKLSSTEMEKILQIVEQEVQQL